METSIDVSLPARVAPDAPDDAPVDRPVDAVRPDRATVAVAATCLLVCMGAPSTFVALHIGGGQGGPRSWVFLYPFAAVAVVGLVALGRHLTRMPIRSWPMPIWFVAAYVAWAMLSAAWSVAPEVTASAALTGVGIAAFGCWFGWQLRIDEQIWAVVIATSVAVLTSAFFIAFAPGIGRMPPRGANPGGEWQGVFGNRNSLAPVCVLGLLGLVALLVSSPSVRRLAFVAPIAVVELVLLRGSGALTSLIALALMSLTVVLLFVVRRLSRTRVPGWLVATVAAASCAAVAAVVFAKLDVLATKIGRDPTLSRRRWIWEDVRALISDRPIRGYGFWAFWERPDLTAATYAHHGSAYASAHNSVLEVLLGLGVIGLVAYLALGLFVIAGVAAWTWARPSLASWWWALVVVFVLTQNLMESFVLWHSYIWVLFIAAAFAPYGRAAESPRW